ncbi:DeoR/GlpR family DNA-binding transcription regulator [Coraliomargarita sp. W4R53]
MINPRQHRLLSLLSIDVESKSSNLIEQLGISEATLRRDLSDLVESGKIIRTHGGALLRPEALNEASFIDKEQAAPEHKRAIAACAANLVPAGASIYIDSGTTCLELARLLLRRGDCQIFTNSLPVMVEACKYNANVTGIGGKLREVSRALIGPSALNWLENLSFDYSVMGASAANTKRGLFTTETQEASVKQHAIQASEESILLCDSSKWSASAPVCYARWSDFSSCVVDEALNDTTQLTLKKQLSVHIASQQES